MSNGRKVLGVGEYDFEFDRGDVRCEFFQWAFTSAHAFVILGPLMVTFYVPWEMWTLEFHSKPCCTFYLGLGPLEVMWARE
jgi:hypothetical protein